MPDDISILDDYDPNEYPPPSPDTNDADRRTWAIGIVTELTDTHYLPHTRIADHVIVHAAIILDYVDGRIDRTGRPLPLLTDAPSTAH